MPSIWTIALHSLLSLAFSAAGVYVYIEKKMFVGGRFSVGDVYVFDFPANIVMAAAFILVSMVMLLSLYTRKWARKVSEWMLILSLVLFISGSFI
jgi:hypothetical protein